MCRASTEGGRRCPHDSSAARQARRIAQTFADYSEQSQTVTVSFTNVEVFTTVEDGKKTVDNMLDNAKKQVELKQGKYVAEDGKEFYNVYEFLDYTGVLLEKKIVKLGATIVNEIEKKTGVKFDSIVEEYNNELVGLTAQVDSLMDEERVVKQKAATLLNVSEDDRLIFDKVRLAASHNPENAEMVELRNQVDVLTETKTRLNSEISQLENGYNDSVREKYSTNINALLQVLNSVRSFGGTLETSSKSDRKKNETLKQVAQFYPTEWLEQSNQNPVKLVVKNTNGRAHYTHWAKTAKVSPLYKIMAYDEPPKDMDSVITLTADEEGHIKYANEDLNINIDGYHYLPNETVYLMPQWEHPNPWTTRYNPDGSPKGYGWKPYIHEHTGETAWRRVIRQRQSSVDKTSANILVDRMVNRVNKVEGFDSAIHELAHRMEAVEVPFLKNVQKAFYERRTTNPDGSPQPAVKLYKGRKEYAVPDSFASDYMGKKYSGDVHYEILSTGMEAIFGGEYAGGLIGLKNKKPDKDMFNFIVGTLGAL